MVSPYRYRQKWIYLVLWSGSLIWSPKVEEDYGRRRREQLKIDMEDGFPLFHKVTESTRTSPHSIHRLWILVGQRGAHQKALCSFRQLNAWHMSNETAGLGVVEHAQVKRPGCFVPCAKRQTGQLERTEESKIKMNRRLFLQSW